MQPSRRLLARGLPATFALLAAAAAAGCTGSVGGDSNPGSGSGGAASGNHGSGGGNGQHGSGGSSGNHGSGGGSNPTGTGGTPGGGSGGSPPGGCTGSTCACVPGIPATTQIPRMTTAQYDQVVNDLLGVTTLATAGNVLPSSMLAPDSAGSLTDIGWNGYQNAAQTIAAEVMAGSNKSKFISCDPTTNTTTCLTNTIKTFGRKAFRRPVTDAEVQSFMRLASLTPAGTPTQVAQAILNAFLASPSFIMLPELAQTQTANGSAIQLDSYEVATRLSFLLWNSVPDDTLNTAANAGQLTSKDQILAQAQRMLQSPKASALVTTFHHQSYLGIETGSHWVNNTTHDPEYPAFTANSYAPLMAEIDSFFQDVVLKGGAFKDLFLSNVAFVTKDTAAIYGLTGGNYTSTPTRTTLDSTQRPGFLTRAGFLSTFSHSDTSSPILRGAFITGRVLGIPPGTPDPKFLTMMPPPADYTTNRQAIEALTKVDPCNACHPPFINPPGFVLEHYNAVGSWQDTDPLGGAIDGTADVIFTDGGDPKTMTSPIQMMTEIANTPGAQRNYMEHFVSFATGRVANSNDACTVDQVTTTLASGSILDAMAAYTQADSFSQRTKGN